MNNFTSNDWIVLVRNILERRLLNKNTKNYFRSEADFQFDLASEIKKAKPEIGIHLEYKPQIDGKFSKHPIDIVIIDNHKKYAIELKYSAWEDNECQAGTKDSHKCQYGFLFDIKTTEDLLEKTDFEKGFCLFLTNKHSLYTKQVKEYPFSEDITIYDSKDIKKNQEIQYKGNDSSMKSIFNFKNNYSLKWHDINLSKEFKSYNFKLLALEISKNIIQ